MRRLSLATQRRIFCWSLGLGFVGLALWIWSAGIPVIWGPSASASDIRAGRELFEHEWEPNDPLAHGDGLGPVFNAKSCAACHFKGGLGGGGEVMHNAVSFEAAPRPDDPEFRSGTIHNFSVSPSQQESMTVLRGLYPVIPGRTISNPGCPNMKVPDYDPLLTQSVQATALFGAGWIDLISDKAIRNNQRTRQVSAVAKEMKLDFASVPVGRIPVADDGRVGKFGWKGQTSDLETFVAAACANEIGLGTPKVPQTKPLSASMADTPPDLDRKQFRALVAFVKTLPRPVEVPPVDPAEKAVAARGKDLFKSVGCALCHVPDIGGVRGVYTDFLLYNLDLPIPSGESTYGNDPPRQLGLPPRPDNLPKPSQWKTPALWGVADSAPYFHDGASATLEDAVSRHQGDAAKVTTAYQELGQTDRAAVIAFLKTLKAPPDAAPLSNSSVIRLKK
ncbi:MAG TPA: di-heme oxidoredictase family protein [Gemmataceae bacterium]|jgi:mono/diheme cytochrome c family protein|nr:di-heme oxidoredictase family protein [Gemmataceae bacterium]